MILEVVLISGAFAVTSITKTKIPVVQVAQIERPRECGDYGVDVKDIDCGDVVRLDEELPEEKIFTK